MDEDNWQQVTPDITSLSLALETFEEGDERQQAMLLEIMMRCAQRISCQLEDLHSERHSAVKIRDPAST